MASPKPRPAIALAIAALALAVFAARWEADRTGDEQASDQLTVSGGTALLGDPGVPGSTKRALADTVDRSELRAGPTVALQPELAAALDSIGRATSAPTTTQVTATSTTRPSTTTTPPTTSSPPAAQPTNVEARGHAALARITYDWQNRLPGWEIRFHTAIEGAYGYTLTEESAIDIYVRTGQSDQLLAHVVAHEIGHAIDVTLNDDADRERWQATRGFDAPWWPDSRASDFATGAGDFAESFAAWQVGTESYRSRLSGPPTGEQLTVLAELAAG